jgi:hypothetical protein
MGGRKKGERMTYQGLLNMLGKKEARTIDNNTVLKRKESGALAIELHGHEILTFFSGGSVRYDSRGYQTVTTKERMNHYGADGWTVYQKDYSWYMAYVGNTKGAFKDGCIVDGNVLTVDGWDAYKPALP